MNDNGLTIKQKEIIMDILCPFAERMDSVGLFGSRATGLYRDNSDIDLIIYGLLTENDVDRLWTLFDASPLALKVDVNVYSLITYPALKAHIDNAMIPLFSKQDMLSAKKKKGDV